MNGDNSFSFDVYPGLDTDLDAALARNVAGGTATAEAIAKDGLSAVVNEAVGAIEDSPVGIANLAPPFRQEVETARNISHELLLRNGTTVPELDSEAFADIDWEKLQNAHAVMLGAGWQPEIVVSRTGGDPVGYWRSLYSDLPGITNRGGLVVNETVEQHWAELESPPAWTVTVVPTTAEPQVRRVPYDMSKVDLHATKELDERVIDALDLGSVTTLAELYPDISTYLTLQAVRLKSVREPIDPSLFTWLRGTFSDNGIQKAPYAGWVRASKQVYIYFRELNYQTPELGVRPTVEGKTL